MQRHWRKSLVFLRSGQERTDSIMNEEKKIWQKTRAELFRDYGCSDEGLSDAEAKARFETHGPNELASGQQKSTLRIFLEQFADFLVIILILAAVVSAILGDVESTVVILAVITMNAILGTVQTVKAAASLDSLKQARAEGYDALPEQSAAAIMKQNTNSGSFMRKRIF